MRRIDVQSYREHLMVPTQPLWFGYTGRGAGTACHELNATEIKKFSADAVQRQLDTERGIALVQ